MIVEGSLLPGKTLGQDAIASQFWVSAIPVCEAFRQLESEGWVTIEPNRGVAVRLQSADEAHEIYEIRASLESLAIGIGIAHHTPETLANAQRLLEATENEPDPALYVVRNEKFLHMSLYAPADRPRLMELIGQMHRRGERYLRLKLGLPIHKDASDAEHRAILAVFVARDIEQAQTLVEHHLLATGELDSPLSRRCTGARRSNSRHAAHAKTHAKKKRRASSRTTPRQAKQ
ncbi:putative regulator PutR for proline utilization, GntR family [Candidatus Paraburkholderia calva]|nr:putative regulator PutR for proline utilization, GntR family [Candidatus Paraburkholderia calva]